MFLTRKSSAWLLASLVGGFTFFFIKYLAQANDLTLLSFFQGTPTVLWLSSLFIGLTILFVSLAIWKFENSLIALLFSVHIICPLIFFTDLTRNPYFTQIILLNVWIAFFWIVWAWECWRNGRILFPKTVLDLPLLLFLGVALMSYLFSFLSHNESYYPSILFEGGRGFLFLLINCYAVFYAAALLEVRWRKRFIWTTFFVGIFAGLYGLMQHFGLERIWKLNINPFGTRPISTFGNPNFLSSYLLMLCPLMCAELMGSKKNRFILLILYLLVSLGAITATFTRSSWIGVIISLILFFTFFPLKEILRSNVRRFVTLGAIFFTVVLFWPKKSLGSYENIFQRISEIREIKSDSGYAPWHQRILIWSASMNMVKEHPFLGKGWGLFELFYPFYQGEVLLNNKFKNLRTHANNAHNEILEIWSQTGIFGLGIYLWIWVLILWFGLKFSRASPTFSSENCVLAWGLTVAAIGMFADNFFGNVSLHFAVPAFLFWWQLGILFGLEPMRYSLDIKTKGKITLIAIALILSGTVVWNFKREFQEIYFFKGFSISKDIKKQDSARIFLEIAWGWYSKEVNTNYELGNTYARLAQIVGKEGLGSQAQIYATKALWAYREALRSNPGYDEIHFNLASTLTQINKVNENREHIKVLDPLGRLVSLDPEDLNTAIYHYSQALWINPYSTEVYHILQGLQYSQS